VLVEARRFDNFHDLEIARPESFASRFSQD